MAVTRFQVELSIAAAVVVLDQIVKAVVRSTWTFMKASSSFRRSSASRGHNYGAAFGLMNAAEFPFKTVVLSIVATLALGALSWCGATLPPEQRLARLGWRSSLAVPPATSSIAWDRGRCRFRRPLLAGLALLGVQRRRRRDHSGRLAADSRFAAIGRHRVSRAV